MSDEVYVLMVDPASLSAQQERQVRLHMMLVEAEALSAQADRLTDTRRCILLRMRDHRRAGSLLHRADALMAEIARLLGEDYTPLSRRWHLPGHPLAWWAMQWTCGIYNAGNLLLAIYNGRPVLALVLAVGLVACTFWSVPPFRLAKQGKWT